MRKSTIIVTRDPKPVYSGHLRLGGSDPEGNRIGVTNYYLTINDKPFFAICGEFHYSRYPCQYWETELRKIKAAGVNIVSTYVFWNHHEEEEGEFTWTDGRNYAIS